MDWSPKSRLVLAILVLTVGLDQLTKEWALHRLSRNRTIEILPTLELDLTFNTGFSFGTGAGNGHLIGLLVAVVCIGVLFMIGREQRLSRATILALILGGALGNLVDRLLRGDGFLDGEVVDFIDVTWYAVFNVADMFVVCGCVLLVISELRRHQPLDETPTRSEVGEPPYSP